MGSVVARPEQGLLDINLWVKRLSRKNTETGAQHVMGGVKIVFVSGLHRKSRLSLFVNPA